MGFPAVVDVLGAAGCPPRRIQLAHVLPPRRLHQWELRGVREQQGLEFMGLNVWQESIRTASNRIDDRRMEPRLDGDGPIYGVQFRS